MEARAVDTGLVSGCCHEAPSLLHAFFHRRPEPSARPHSSKIRYPCMGSTPLRHSHRSPPTHHSSRSPRAESSNNRGTRVLVHVLSLLLESEDGFQDQSVSWAGHGFIRKEPLKE